MVVPLTLGDITSAQMEVVAELADRYAGGTLRTSQQQDLLLRNVADTDLPTVFRALSSAGLAGIGIRASVIADVTSCPGTTACSLAITTSKGLANQRVQMLGEAGYQDDEALGTLRIKISGCPDACGHHYLADIGLYGCALHVAGRLYPAYHLLPGARLRRKEPGWPVPWRNCPPEKCPGQWPACWNTTGLTGVPASDSRAS